MYSIEITNPTTGLGAMYLCLRDDEAELLAKTFSNAFNNQLLITIQKQSIEEGD